MFSIDVRTDIVPARLREKTYEDVYQNFRKPGPIMQSIRDRLNKFQKIENIADEDHSRSLVIASEIVQTTKDVTI